MLGSRIVHADSWLSRFRGLLGRPEPEAGEGLLLVPCGSVHMLGMRYAIDVALLNRERRVVSLHPRLVPGWRVAGRSSGSPSVAWSGGATSRSTARPRRGRRYGMVARNVEQRRGEPLRALEARHVGDVGQVDAAGAADTGATSVGAEPRVDGVVETARRSPAPGTRSSAEPPDGRRIEHDRVAVRLLLHVCLVGHPCGRPREPQQGRDPRAGRSRRPRSRRRGRHAPPSPSPPRAPPPARTQRPRRASPRRRTR